MVLARPEVVGGLCREETETSTVVPVGAGEEPPAAPFAQQGVPEAVDIRRIDSRAALGATERRGAETAVVLGLMPGLSLAAEGDVGAGVVEIAEVLA